MTRRNLNLHVYFHVSSRGMAALCVFVAWVAVVIVLTVEQVRFF